MISAIRSELASYYPHTQSGSIKAFGPLVAGTIETILPNSDLSRVADILNLFVVAINETVLDSLDAETSACLIYSLDYLADMIVHK